MSVRASVLQLSTNQKEYECASDKNGINLKLQVKKSYTCILLTTGAKFCRTKIRHCTNIIYVYVSNTLRVKDNPTELDQLYIEVANVTNDIKSSKTTSTSLLLMQMISTLRYERTDAYRFLWCPELVCHKQLL